MKSKRKSNHPQIKKSLKPSNSLWDFAKVNTDKNKKEKSPALFPDQNKD